MTTRGVVLDNGLPRILPMASYECQLKISRFLSQVRLSGEKMRIPVEDNLDSSEKSNFGGLITRP